MARANRHYQPGLIWHITHRCHKREFLLKFARDKRTWSRWILEAKKIFGLCILNYTITSNHIHLLVLDQCHNDGQTIPRSLQLAAGRVAQEYNKRKHRSGAFWEDRYHATAIETGDHFITCITYIDLNMVRAKVIGHPSEWPFGGYFELQQPRQRFRNQLVDGRELLRLLGMKDLKQLRAARADWLGMAHRWGVTERDPKWTQSVAVGGRDFKEKIAEKLGRTVKVNAGEGERAADPLHGAGQAYLCVLGGKNADLEPKTGHEI